MPRYHLLGLMSIQNRLGSLWDERFSGSLKAFNISALLTLGIAGGRIDGLRKLRGYQCLNQSFGILLPWGFFSQSCFNLSYQDLNLQA